ncbi:hypothetical protein [Sphingomonas sp. URHD0057]|uniref:hypothetical protein n=1 Tax=Sphingomonas sp. URHD0057 TaxID=1380389 RepID=UPI0004919EB1|nr:hypothetical protein [Sphingomonas sp. URHD0057]
MKPAPALKLVATEPTVDEIRQQSAREGKHLSDAMRLTIMARNWNACHIEGDRRAAVHIDEPRKGWWR